MIEKLRRRTKNQPTTTPIKRDGKNGSAVPVGESIKQTMQNNAHGYPARGPSRKKSPQKKSALLDDEYPRRKDDNDEEKEEDVTTTTMTKKKKKKRRVLVTVTTTVIATVSNQCSVVW